MIEKNGRRSPTIGQVVAVVVGGGIAIAAGAFTSVGRVVLAFAAVVLVLILGVGLAVRRQIARKFPPVIFQRNDVTSAREMIESAGSRLASGDSAAFAIHPRVDDSGQAGGQIWLFAAADGVLGRVAIELALPDSVDDVNRHPAIAALLSSGWEVLSDKPQEWVVLARSDLAETPGLLLVVVDAVAALFEIPVESAWSCRAIA